MPISTAEMKDKLLTVEETVNLLSATEPLSGVAFSAKKGDATFSLPEGWNVGLKEADGMALTQATCTIDGVPYQLTKDAALEATSNIQLTKDYVCKTPGPLVEMHLNYWMAHGTKDLKLLTRAVQKDDGEFVHTGLAVAKASIEPFSNVQLVQQAIEIIQDKIDLGGENVLVDYKLQHDLRRTAVRLIAPDVQTTISGDPWSLGIEIRNSLVGEKPLNISGYLFNWTCTNGMTSVHATSGNYNRRTIADDKVYEWAAAAVEDAIGGLEHELDAIAELPKVSFDESIADVLSAVFDRYQVPIKLRESIIKAMENSDDLTAYGLLNAVTQSANAFDIDEAPRSTVLKIGGALPGALGERCEACNRLPL